MTGLTVAGQFTVPDDRRLLGVPTHTALGVLELAAIFVFAISAALTAVQKGLDAVEILVLAESLLWAAVSFAISSSATPLQRHFSRSATCSCRWPRQRSRSSVIRWCRLTFGVLLFDAAGLALFTVTGTLKALEHGLRAVQSAVLGVTTGVGGGLLRDIIGR